jgi:hypothetical protein
MLFLEGLLHTSNQKGMPNEVCSMTLTLDEGKSQESESQVIREAEQHGQGPEH